LLASQAKTGQFILNLIKYKLTEIYDPGIEKKKREHKQRNTSVNIFSLPSLGSP